MPALERLLALLQAFINASMRLRERLKRTIPGASAGSSANVPAEFRDAVQQAMRLEQQAQRNLHLAGQVVGVWQRVLDRIPPGEEPAFRAAVLVSLGNAYYNLPTGDRGANLACALECYREALTTYTPETTPFQYATTQNNLGIVYADLLTADHGANLARAIECYQEALRFRTPEAAPLDYAMTQNNLGNAYSRLLTGDQGANLARAIGCYGKALTIYTPEAWSERCLVVATNMGLLTADRVVWHAAFGDSVGAAYRRWQVAAEGFGTAVAALAPLLEEADVEGRRRLIEENAASHAYSPFGRKGFDKVIVSYWQAVEATFNLGQPDRCLALVEAGKSRRFLAELAETAFAPPPGMPVRWLEQEAELRERRAALRSAAARASGAEQARLWHDLDAARAALNALYDQMEAAGFADYVDLRRGWPPDFDDIRHFVDRQGAGTLLLAFDTLPENTLVFALAAGDETPLVEEVPLDQERLTGFLLAAQEEIFSPPQECTAPMGTSWRQLSGQLLPSKFDPLLERTHRLYIVPEGQFHRLPLHALLWRSEPLVSYCPVIYAPSVGVAARAQGRQRGGTQPITAFGYVEDPNLRGVFEGEAIGIAGLFGAEARTGHQATPDAVLQAAADARVLHVSSHGAFVPGEPMQSGLELAGGRLTAERVIAEGHLPGSLVNLSACVTGRARLETGDELNGLMRAFFQAGAATLVLSLWSVSAEATMVLMGDFYTRLQAGSERDVALREAMLALRHELPHPYYWAPFIVAGDWHA